MRGTRRKGCSGARWTALAALGALAPGLLAGCGDDRSGGPRGPALEVVGQAPELTRAQGTGTVAAAAPGASSQARLDLDDPAVQLPVDGSPRGPLASTLLSDPLVALDLLRGVTEVEIYGGAEVRGASTIRYELDLDLERALGRAHPGRRAAMAAIRQRFGGVRMFGDVWVDSQGRVRRVQLPTDVAETRPMGRDRRARSFITVDFFEFDASHDANNNPDKERP